MDLETTQPPPGGCPAAGIADPFAYLTGSRHPLWARMRETGSVQWTEPEDGLPGHWNITGYRESNQILRDHRAFSSEHGTILASVQAGGDSAGGSTITLLDPPRHRAIRSHIAPHLTVEAATRAEPAIRERVRSLIGPWLAGGRHDIALDMERLSAWSFGEVIGILPEHWDELSRWTTASIAPEDPQFAETGDADTVLLEAHHHLFACFRAALAVRRAEPRDDIVSTLAHLAVDGRPLTERERLLNIYSVVLGASTTTPHVANHLLLLFARRPRVWDRVRSGEIDIGELVEEGVRWVTPTNHLVRRAAKDVELGDRTIASGDWVCAWVAAANRDPERFADGDSFQPGRRGTHLGFGVGPHHCIGVHFARVALRVLLEELVPTVHRLEPSGTVRHLASNWINGIVQLPLTFHVGEPWTC
jgi:cytochrome P450